MVVNSYGGEDDNADGRKNEINNSLFRTLPFQRINECWRHLLHALRYIYSKTYWKKQIKPKICQN